MKKWPAFVWFSYNNRGRRLCFVISVGTKWATLIPLILPLHKRKIPAAEFVGFQQCDQQETESAFRLFSRHLPPRSQANAVLQEVRA